MFPLAQTLIKKKHVAAVTTVSRELFRTYIEIKIVLYISLYRLQKEQNVFKHFNINYEFLNGFFLGTYELKFYFRNIIKYQREKEP